MLRSGTRTLPSLLAVVSVLIVAIGSAEAAPKSGGRVARGVYGGGGGKVNGTVIVLAIVVGIFIIIAFCCAFRRSCKGQDYDTVSS